MKVFINLPTWLGDTIMASVALRLVFSHFESLVKNDTKIFLSKTSRIIRHFITSMQKP